MANIKPTTRVLRSQVTRIKQENQEPGEKVQNVEVSVMEVEMKPPIRAAPPPPPPPDECCICQREVVDPARLDCCEHIECFLCLKHWLKHNMVCCVCRGVPKKNVIRLGQRGADYLYPLEELIKEKEKEERERAAADVPLTFERSIIRRAKHEYQAALEQINRAPQPVRTVRKKSRRVWQQRLADKQYSDMVDAVNGLNVILDENNRKTVISNPHFRKLIYKYLLEWYPATETTLNRGGTYAPRYARDHEDTEKTRITAFIVKELDNVQYKNNSIRTYQRRLRLADFIFDKMKDIPIQAPPFLRVFDLECQIRRDHAARLQQEIFNFAASGLSEDDFYTISCYRVFSNNHGSPAVFAVGGLNANERQPEVVTLDDEQEDDDIQIEHVQISAPSNESNFLRDEGVSSGSERDVLFQRRACRFQPPPLLPALPAFYPGAGVSYNSVLHPRPSMACENVLGNTELNGEFGGTRIMIEAERPRYRSVFGRPRPATPEVILSSPEQTTMQEREGSVEFCGIRPLYEPRSPSYAPLPPQPPPEEEYQPRSPEQLTAPSPPREQEMEMEYTPAGSDEPSSASSDNRHHRSKLEKYRQKYFKYLEREESRSKIKKERHEMKRQLVEVNKRLSDGHCRSSRTGRQRSDRDYRR